MEIVKLVLNTKKPETLHRIEEFLKQEQSTDWWDNTSDPEKEAINKGLTEAEEGKVIPHEDVMKEKDELLNTIQFIIELNQETRLLN